jgi:N-acetylmuramoyl-L-alanine amidase
MTQTMRRKLWLAWCLIGCLMPVVAFPAADDDTAVRCLALNLYWEARSEGREGMLAVGWVVLNRVAHPKFPNTVCEVIHQGGEKPPCEWSWWCDGRSDRPTAPKSWAIAQDLARKLLSQPPADPTHGALWFHHEKLGVPRWWKSRKPTAHIGHHKFYK